MKKLYCVVLVGALFQPMFQLHAQEKPKAEEHVKVPTPIKVQIVFTELDGDKRVSSMPYSFTVVSDERMGGKYSTSIRTGIRVPIETASVVGDSVWDMLAARRARALGIGVLSGGYGTEELERAGAYRVFDDPADLLKHLDEVGGRR